MRARPLVLTGKPTSWSRQLFALPTALAELRQGRISSQAAGRDFGDNAENHDRRIAGCRNPPGNGLANDQQGIDADDSERAVVAAEQCLYRSEPFRETSRLRVLSLATSGWRLFLSEAAVGRYRM